MVTQQEAEAPSKSAMQNCIKQCGCETARDVGSALVKPGKKWLRMAEIYRRFAKDYPQADLSDEAAMAMYRHETFGDPMPQTGKLNGFELGKKWMDVTVAGWKEEIPQLGLLVSELQEDGYPDWFLERVGVLHLVPTLNACLWWLERPNAGVER